MDREQHGKYRHGGDGMIRNVTPEVHDPIHGTPIAAQCKRVLPAVLLSLNIAHMPNFDLDPDYRAFIDSYLAATRLSTATSVAQQRADYQYVIDRFRYPYPAGIDTDDSRIDGRHGPVPLRRYRCARPADQTTRILFVHGGGFILGSLDSHDDICAELCARSGYELVSIGYRLAPEFHHPVQLDDVEDGFHAADRGRSILVGVSAGGTLCAALGHRLRQAAARPAGQVLIYPSLGGDCFDLASYRDNAEAPLLTTADIRFYRGVRCKDGIIPAGDAEYYPLVAADFGGLPPTVAQSADIDPLRDDADLYVQKLSAAGIAAEWINEPGLTHDYLRARHMSRRAGEAFTRVCEAITRLAREAGAN
ncbi:MAG: alpha/beta hydrolase [Gammaproteobacteria bacterium]|nr:alpha/beta hydrolase [Gammaproteobacteria bacterium]